MIHSAEVLSAVAVCVVENDPPVEVLFSVSTYWLEPVYFTSAVTMLPGFTARLEIRIIGAGLSSGRDWAKSRL